MSKIDKKSGSCICGSVRITAINPSIKVGACHCGTCRKWGGGPFMEIDCGTDILFEGEEYITIFNSSIWAERGFCKKCGSHLFYRLKETQQHMLAVGLFDDQEELVFDNQVFIDRKPSFYSFSNKTKNLTEKQVFEMYGPL
ncbi:GFA family protein [Shewanella gelidii]|uniref:Aldehyde-activating protein n=1 Tax=Shewanella gelidii TaxID=1642821 RepID=A0A917NCZ8_9GAMM|nr:GFA family protein [Shewanella gelidii]MCL1098049.1 GFA family protein [Shewanella gelidii]GGI85745.1 aldehyde-activating protein [Shewanella gelidii]